MPVRRTAMIDTSTQSPPAADGAAAAKAGAQPDPQETREWLDALDGVIEAEGAGRASELVRAIVERAATRGVRTPAAQTTPYVNTIPVEEQAHFPGDHEIEERLRHYIRWNAMAMVVRANKDNSELGGPVASFSSSATLYDIGLNHFWRGPEHKNGGDLVYFQGHSSPGIYARAFLDGRVSEEQLENFRREVDGKGVPSYPHPWLMPDFWQFATVSMGLGPLQAVYQARYMRYLHDRGLADTSDRKGWGFLGDGEIDEPESLAGLAMAAREKLDNLIFVVNCNLQRLDGPVRGNGKIIQELEGLFRGAGWNVIKVIWGTEWDDMIKRDKTGLLLKRMGECVDGDYQKYTVEPGSYTRKHFFGKYPELLELVNHLSDEQISKLLRGGHDTKMVYAAYKSAMEHKGQPTVILAKTVKGYGLGEAGEGKNITHQQKKMNEKELREFRGRFDIPISDDVIAETPFYRPPIDSVEIKYLLERRKALGGFLPARIVKPATLDVPKLESFSEFFKGSSMEASTTMAFVRLMTILLRHKGISKNIVPIIPDEERTVGL